MNHIKTYKLWSYDTSMKSRSFKTRIGVSVLGGLAGLLGGCSGISNLPPEHQTEGRQVVVFEGDIQEEYKEIFNFDLKGASDSMPIRSDVYPMNAIGGEEPPFDTRVVCDIISQDERHCSVQVIDNDIQYHPSSNTHWTVNIDYNQGIITSGHEEVVVSHFFSPSPSGVDERVDDLEEVVEEIIEDVDVLEEIHGIGDGDNGDSGNGNDDPVDDRECLTDSDCTYLDGTQGVSYCSGTSLVRDYFEHSCNDVGDCVGDFSHQEVQGGGDCGPSELDMLVDMACSELPRDSGMDIKLYEVSSNSDFSWSENMELQTDPNDPAAEGNFVHHVIPSNEGGKYFVAVAGNGSYISGMSSNFSESHNGSGDCNHVLVLNSDMGGVSDGIYTVSVSGDLNTAEVVRARN